MLIKYNLVTHNFFVSIFRKYLIGPYTITLIV